VQDYDEALAFFVGKLDFELVEDTPIPSQNKRWVVVKPPGSDGCHLLLAQASTAEQESRIGNQTRCRVFLFLYTNNFSADYNKMRSKGITFIREPKEEAYGTVAVFKDIYGNQWDLLQPNKGLNRGTG
jgi:uncharacterized glyoxalase superfamily protein PhnB